jgi:hypothetical protein
MIKDIFLVKVAIFATLTALNLHCKSRQFDDLKAINLIVSYPVTLTNIGDVSSFNLKDTISVFYHGHLILYKLLARRKTGNEEKLKGSESYFIYEEDNPAGYLFDNLSDDAKGKKLSVDSFLTQRAFSSATFDNSSLKLTERKDSGNILVEKYIPLKSDGNMFDSIYYYYSTDLENIHYSFSRKLDNLSGMKLYQARILFTEKFSIEYNLMLPKREFLFKIEKMSCPNSIEILHFFETKRKLFN